MASNGVPQPHHTPYQADFLRDNSDRGLRVWALLDLQRQYRVSKQDLEDGKRQLEQQHYDQCHCLFQQRKYIIGGDARLVCRDSDGRTVWQFYHGPQRWLELIRGEEKRIPGFWLQPMKNNPEVAQWVSARDEQALKCLSNISVEPIRGDDAGPVAPAFRLVFEFDSNPFFRNSSLVKDFYYRHKSVDDNIHVGLACNDAPGCSIDWNTGMDLTMAPVNDPCKCPPALLYSPNGAH
ncbi:nucleosome assembly protein-domain-containing protein [Lasiosphaeria ovina]|uniref:Nucleosome assembly protein-domain-containing protein n=1 Tax=Lasiosphaeria ovina TaxID=92902 RepID=A0AAE0JXH1_9PEZI|nr:nucleosome assembly protein-domain-containing protein [Lasiosphaeria ovina]